MEEGSRMGILSTKGGNRILTSINFESPNNSWVEGVNPRDLTVHPRVSADTGRPPETYAGSQPCMRRVMGEIVVPSLAIPPLSYHSRPHSSAPSPSHRSYSAPLHSIHSIHSCSEVDRPCSGLGSKVDVSFSVSSQLCE